jgi:DNA-binding NarL/FixJ family response regulator
VPSRVANNEDLSDRSVNAGDPNPLRVVVASDDPLSRDAIKAASSAPGIQLLAAAGVGAMTEQLGELKPDVVVLDAQQSAVDALATLHRLRADAPTVRILVFSSPESVEFGVLCLCTGASGYLSKDIDMSALGRIVRGLGRGETVVSRALATELIARLREAQPRPSQHPRPALSASERRLLELLRTGHSIAEAAAQLGVAESTIRRRLASARRKLLPRGSDDGRRVRISSRTQPHSRSEES